MPDEVKPDEPQTGSAASVNPLDLSQLRESADYTQQVAVSRKQLVIPVRKPHKTEWIRVRPGEDYRFSLRMYVTRDKSFYAVAPAMRDELDGHLKPFQIVQAITRSGDVFLWPLQTPDDNDNAGASWHRSAIRAARQAEISWVRIEAAMKTGGYVMSEPRDALPDPVWPEDTLQELVDRAFAHNLIDGYDHPIIKELEGRL